MKKHGFFAGRPTPRTTPLKKTLRCFGLRKVSLLSMVLMRLYLSQLIPSRLCLHRLRKLPSLLVAPGLDWPFRAQHSSSL
jgi:hypothetical protein